MSRIIIADGMIDIPIIQNNIRRNMKNQKHMEIIQIVRNMIHKSMTYKNKESINKMK